MGHWFLLLTCSLKVIEMTVASFTISPTPKVQKEAIRYATY
jgi:hypothetical protein